MAENVWIPGTGRLRSDSTMLVDELAHPRSWLVHTKDRAKQIWLHIDIGQGTPARIVLADLEGKLPCSPQMSG